MKCNSTILPHKLWPVYSPVGDSARPDQDSMAGLTGEIASVTHRSIILPLGRSKLKSEPDPWSEVSGAHVPNSAHLAGAGEEDLGALVQPHTRLEAAWAGAAPAPAQSSFRSGEAGAERKNISKYESHVMQFIIFHCQIHNWRTKENTFS